MMNRNLLFFLALFCQIFMYGSNKSNQSIFIDSSVNDISISAKKADQQSFHLFSHGRSGELFIDNEWLDATKIVKKFKNDLQSKKALYIYGCNFAQGEKGRAAVLYLEEHLNINVNASTNITGANGDWKLEIGTGKNELKLLNFKGNLQLDKTHYLNPMISGAYNTSTSIEEEYIYLSTPSTTDITIQMNYASGVGSPRISITDLTTSTVTYTNSGSITFKNSTPKRLQFVGAAPANTVVSPGTTPSTLPLNTGGTVISGSSSGLVFTSTDEFFVNYRARSNAQAGSVLTKGLVALGTEFRWGGSPVEFATPIVEIGNMLSVMATEDNTTIVIDNIKPGTKFVNGTLGTTLTGPSINKLLQKGDSFILYAPVQSNTLSIQDTGWLGAKIISDKNIAVTVGGLMQQGNIPSSRDIGFDQLVPVTRLGLEYIAMKGNGGASEKVIVVSTAPNTKVYLNGSITPFATLVNAGDYVLIPSTSFNADRNMLINVNAPTYVFLKIYGSSADNTNSLLFIPPLSCFGEKFVDLIPDARKIGTTTYTGTEMVVLAAAGIPNIPVVKENGATLSAYATGAVTGNSNWMSYRYNLTAAVSNVKVTSAGTIQAEVFGANSAAGFGGYFSGFGDAPTYMITVTGPFGFICPGSGTLTVDPGLGSYQWLKNNVAIPGATSNSYTLNPVTDTAIATYFVIVTFPGGCTVRSNQVTSDVCPCTKPGATGTPDSFTKVGISVRDERTTANWPKDIGNGFITMEANNKGFVITRLASPETAVTNPVLGMLVYDTTIDCLKLYNGTSWNCIQPTCN